MQVQPTLYDSLQVSPHASAQVIRAAYRSLSQCNHPDKLAGSGTAHQRQMQLNGAYAVLSDPRKRRCYDQLLALPWVFTERRGLGKPNAPHGLTSQKTASPEMRAFAFRPLA